MIDALQKRSSLTEFVGEEIRIDWTWTLGAQNRRRSDRTGEGDGSHRPERCWGAGPQSVRCGTATFAPAAPAPRPSLPSLQCWGWRGGGEA